VKIIFTLLYVRTVLIFDIIKIFEAYKFYDTERVYELINIITVNAQYYIQIMNNFIILI
jgi:hypothetical protein